MNQLSTAKCFFKRFCKTLVTVILISISFEASAQFASNEETLPRERYILRVKERKNLSRYSDSIFYVPGRKLIWNDFSGTPSQNSAFAAITRSGFGMHWSDDFDGYTTVINLTVPVYFIKSKSWVKQHARKEYELAHEQLHFDITMLVAQRFITSLQQMDLDRNYANTIQQEYRKFYNQLKVMQSNYDSETNHGLIKSKQKEWREWIEGELENLL